MAIVAPSILSADFSHLYNEVKSVSSAEFLHIDVMDGHFVPNISIGAMVYKNLRKDFDMVFDVHLMITDPMKYAKDFADAGADYITFHYEAVSDVMEMINHLKNLNVKVGISIKPGTDVKVLDPYLKHLDLILIMSVEPGFGGQKFIPSSLDKVKYFKQQKEKNNFLIEIDGGINLETGKLAVDAGCDILVAGSYIFNSTNRKQVIKELGKL
ncbi:MAG TPA: ribulose-phosphate 3-epimerase [Acholeplasmataceae bacterium]|jgi:ribulose-phosphate 3-epimerase|nr:ribulose-phosphate 3-epimerase [Acholeplasmataceae bacterium]